MGKALTNEEFLVKLLRVNIHFNNGRFKVLSKVKRHPESLIVKDEFGYCKMTVNSLFKGAKPSVTSSIFPRNYLINKLRSIRKDFYKNELRIVGDYKRDSHFILIKDKFGVCNALISNMYKGRGLSIGSAIDKRSYFINKVDFLRPNVFNLTQTFYGETGDSEINIICDKHGIFKTTPNVFYAKVDLC